VLALKALADTTKENEQKRLEMIPKKKTQDDDE
jgi:hypothetical protein